MLRYVLIFVGTLPLWVFIPAELPGLGALGRTISLLLSEVCQKDPQRALSLFSVELSCCARCTGLYLGLGLGAALLRPYWRRAQLWTWFGFSLAVMGLDVATEYLGMRPSNAWLRLVTGVLVAYPASLLGLLDVRDARRISAARLDPKPE